MAFNLDFVPPFFRYYDEPGVMDKDKWWVSDFTKNQIINRLRNDRETIQTLDITIHKRPKALALGAVERELTLDDFKKWRALRTQ